MSKDNKVITPTFRVSFPHVFTPTAMEEGKEKKFSLVGLFPADEDLTELRNLAKAAIKEKWPTGAPKGLRTPFRDGNEKEYPEFQDMIFISMSSKNRPNVVDEDVQPILNQSEFYAGCYARASVRAYAYDQKGNKGVAFGLINVQKVEDGEPLGGGASDPEDDFSPVKSKAKAKGKPASRSMDDEDDI